jgi:anti-sigma factor RsiW
MMCRDCLDQLIDYAHGELPLDAAGALARHLAACSACALEYCRLQADLQGILEAHDEAPRPRVFHALRRRVAREVAPPWWKRTLRPLLRPVPMYGAVLAAVVPIAIWAASAASRPHAPPTETHPAASRGATLTDYDATAVLPAHRDVL